MRFIQLTKDNIDTEHICCAFSDKKCAQGYQLKKQWLTAEFANAYAFRRLDERAKVFIEYGPAEKAWVPVTAPNHMMIGCFWVSGQYQHRGHGKALLEEAVQTARRQHKSGLVTVVGTKKFHFMSDTRWLQGHGFEVVESLPTGFSLIAMDFKQGSTKPCFNESARKGTCASSKGIVAYYSNRCPYTEYHVNESLVGTARKRGLALKIVKLQTLQQAQSAPTPATIFSLYLDGRFITTDLSACMDTRFDKAVGRS
jgi:GNAT superfamily N-acetyltransferase